MEHLKIPVDNRIKTVIFILYLFLNAASVRAAIEGIPSIKNYTRKEYSAGNQNWAIAQDEFGVMYFGNNNGILIYNGVDWKLTPLPNYSIVRSLKAYFPGKILAGGFDELGVLMRDSLGNYRFISWKNKIPIKERRFGDIWRIHFADKFICFQSRTHLLVFTHEGDYVTTLHPSNEFVFSFLVNNQLVLQEKGSGLKKFESMQLSMIPGSHQMNGLEVWDILPLSDSEWLLFTQQQGVFVWNLTGLKPWNHKLSDFLSDNSFYCMAKDNAAERIYLGTIQQGLIVIDLQGNIIQTLNKGNGLQNNTILSMAFDNEKNLWLGLDNGIDYVETHTNISYLHRPGGFGSGYCSAVLNGSLYLGTNQGVYIYNINNPEYVEPLTQLNGQTWSFYYDGDNLLCAHHSGAYVIKGNQVKKIGDKQGIWMFLPVPWDHDKMLVGSYSGIGLIEKSGNSYTFHKMIDGFKESSRIMLFDRSGNLWISHGYKGIYKIQLNKDDFSIVKVKLYGTDQGLPSDLNNELFLIRDELIAGTRAGIYQYETSKDTFYSSTKWNHFLGSNDLVTKMVENQEHTVWIFQDGVLGRLDILSDSLFQYNRHVAPSLSNNFLYAFESITFLNNDLILLGIEDGFAVIDLRTVTEPSASVPFQFESFEMFNTHKFQTQYHALVFDPMVANITLPDRIPYKFNNMRIRYALPVYGSSHQIRILYNLNETTWEGTPNEPEIVLSGLHEGRYQLTISIENQYTGVREYRHVLFTIDSPWFRRWYTYMGSIMLLLTLAFLTFKIINKRVQRQKRKALLFQKRQMIQREIRLKEKSTLAEQEVIRIKNEKLQSEVIHQSKELANSTMNIIHKSQILTDMKIRLIELIERGSGFEKEELRKLVRKIDRELDDRQSWSVFETNFDRVHENFFQRVREKHTTLTPKDLRMCAFLRMNLSSKEIAPLQNISIRSVEISRYRLRKKLDLPHDKNLTDYIMGI